MAEPFREGKEEKLDMCSWFTCWSIVVISIAGIPPQAPRSNYLAVEVPWKFFRYDLILVMQQRFIVSVPNRPQTVKSVAWDHHDGNPIMPISFS